MCGIPLESPGGGRAGSMLGWPMPRRGGSSAIAEGLRKLGSLQWGKLTAQAMCGLEIGISTLQIREGTFVPSNNGVTWIFISIWPQLGQNWQVAHTSSENAGVCKI